MKLWVMLVSARLCWKMVREGLQLACPLGKDLKPSFRKSLSVSVQMPGVTRTQAGLKISPIGFTANSWMRSRSGLHRDSRSGRGFPNKFFMP